MPATNYYAAIYTAPTLEALEAALDRLGNEWYEEVGGDYRNVPTWGPRTEAVMAAANASCETGDIVSWDTTSADPAEHRYLRRRGGRQQAWLVWTHEDVLAYAEVL